MKVLASQKKVTIIPATISVGAAQTTSGQKKRRVAGYARVSTDNEEQQTSYEAQVAYYTEYIKSRSDWEFVGLYSDEGVTGTNTKRREGFNRMIADALAGKIDLIITKSVSRFARNTVDSLSTIRKLKEHNIECYFEKENIWTFDGKGELLITIMSSLAQEESRSISENVKWGQRKRFADGKLYIPYSRFLGYTKGADGNLEIVPEEAKVVRLIYKLFLEGYGTTYIAKELERRKIKTGTGCDTWHSNSIHSILTNEKYKGDALLQKTYTSDFLTKKKKKNKGEIPQYYVKDNHEPIIDPQVFDIVQAELERRKKTYGSYRGNSIFSNKIQCAECGSWYGSRLWHSTDKYRRVIYQCARKYKNEIRCKTPSLKEEEIQEIFVKAVNQFLKGKNEVLENLESLSRTFCNNDDLISARNEYQEKLAEKVEMLQGNAGRNSGLNPEAEESYNHLIAEYQEAREQYEKACEQIKNNNLRQARIDQVIKVLKKQDTFITEFDKDLWCALVERVVVRAKDDITVIFKDGTEIRV